MATKSGKRHAQTVRINKNREKLLAPEIAREIEADEAWRIHRLAQLGVTVVALKN
jgi:hypothetical protein